MRACVRGGRSSSTHTVVVHVPQLENLSPTNKVDMKAVMQPLGPAPTDSSATSKKIKRKRKKGGKKRGGYNPNTPAPNERMYLQQYAVPAKKAWACRFLTLSIGCCQSAVCWVG